ncbi:hypothetical protein SAMN04487951_12311 [Vreelandella arcis]|uniref:Uncharacterized protein n=1 Tax=Vreelandella arcis TaxID=416873 RepID=A0A1H0J0U5_9GAMM|nr:hypothetical protein SAMN04487951_12311 [Halomonas arcis]
MLMVQTRKNTEQLNIKDYNNYLKLCWQVLLTSMLDYCQKIRN